MSENSIDDQNQLDPTNLDQYLIQTASGNITVNNSDCSSKDQGFSRPKVLILAPFKRVAYQIIEMIILLTNNGKWK